MSEERLRLTAYHEAGCAVVSWVVGLEIEGASIEPQESSLGRLTLADIKHIELYDEVMYRLLAYSYAGVKAVELCTGRPTNPDDPNTDPEYQGSDWDAVANLVLTLAGPEEDAQVALQEQAKEEALRVLRENWPGVEAVAQGLLNHRSLDSTDLTRILEEANCPRGKPVYEYELDRLADDQLTLMSRIRALIKGGRQEEARRVAAKLARVKSKMEELARLAER